MKKKVLAVLLAIIAISTVITGCGSKTGGEEQSAAPVAENQTEQTADNAAETEAEGIDDGLDQLDAIGDVDVDKGIFNVTLTIPKDFFGDTTQEKLDESVKENGYKSATLNSDGSVTYVMTKAQHEEMLKGVRESIDQSLSEMVGSSDYPNITNIEHNDDYTSFTITTNNVEPDLSESFSVMAIYTYGGMYGIFSGEKVDNIHVDFKNADSGEIISSSNSKDVGKSD